MFDSAHNEYIHFLLTTGTVGVGSYVVFIAASVIEMVKSIKRIPPVLAILFVVFSYAVQALVNINLPVVFPLIFVLLAMGLAKTDNV